MHHKGELLNTLYTHRTVIKVLFRYYALAGVTSVDDDTSTMTMMQFGNFCRGAQLIDNKNLNVHDVDRLFLRSVRMLPVADDGKANAPAKDDPRRRGRPQGHQGEQGVAQGQAAVSVTALAKGSNLMSQSQFVGALVRICGALRAERELMLGEKLARVRVQPQRPRLPRVVPRRRRIQPTDAWPLHGRRAREQPEGHEAGL